MPAKEDLGVDISRKCMIDFQWMRGVTKVVFEFLFSVERLEIHFMVGNAQGLRFRLLPYAFSEVEQRSALLPFYSRQSLSQAFVVLSQQAEAPFNVPSTCSGHCQFASTCEEYARQAGLPTDGWEIVHDNEGQPKCRLAAVQELCYSVEFFDVVKSVHIFLGLMLSS
ncbi:hypothetical protein BDR04DRAFT_714320 [Suillus decipiens]|nr:hypothetical protein BDR04DRAFT_714320 [Suillus decipiens]